MKLYKSKNQYVCDAREKRLDQAQSGTDKYLSKVNANNGHFCTRIFR